MSTLPAMESAARGLHRGVVLALCIAAALLFHGVVLVAFPGIRQSMRPPLPPVSVTLVTPPPAHAPAAAAQLADDAAGLRREPPQQKEPIPRAVPPRPLPRASVPIGRAPEEAPATPMSPAHTAAPAPPASVPAPTARREKFAPALRAAPDLAAPRIASPASREAGPLPDAGTAAPPRAAGTAKAGETQPAAPAPQRPADAPSGAAGGSEPRAEPSVPAQFDAAYLDNPKPEYPRMARRLGEEGTVLLSVFVSARGEPEKIELHRSSGSPRLDRAARDTVRTWKFVPARKGDRPVGAWVIVPITFVLQG